MALIQAYMMESDGSRVLNYGSRYMNEMFGLIKQISKARKKMCRYNGIDQTRMVMRRKGEVLKNAKTLKGW